MRAEPFVCLGGLELGNALRTLTYLRRGLGGAGYTVLPREPLITEIAGECRTTSTGDAYTSLYHSLYGGSTVTECDPPTPVEPLDAANLRCYCAAYDDGPYVDPAMDPAPWYTAARPESAEFLGFIPWDVEPRPTLARGLAQGMNGAVLGAWRAGGFVTALSGTMYASSREGMEYGQRWLFDAVAGRACDGEGDLLILPACPADGRPARWRTLRRAGLIDEPALGPLEGVAECRMQTVALQLGSEDPFMLADPVAVADEEALVQYLPVSHLVTTDEWVGDAALVITVVAGAAKDLQGLRITGRPVRAGADCSDTSASACFDLSVTIPAGHRMIIDALEEQVTVDYPATGEIVGGLELVDYDPPMPWPVLPPCSQVCVTAYGETIPASTRLSIASYGREL